MPFAAEGAKISRPLTLHAGQQRGVQRITLGAIPALARAALLPLFCRGFFHLRRIPSLQDLGEGAKLNLLLPGEPADRGYGRNCCIWGCV